MIIYGYKEDKGFSIISKDYDNIIGNVIGRFKIRTRRNLFGQLKIEKRVGLIDPIFLKTFLKAIPKDALIGVYVNEVGYLLPLHSHGVLLAPIIDLSNTQSEYFNSREGIKTTKARKIR